ncbi:MULTISPECIES: C39 family peptidase [Enorma]|uniref:C39 family peptidase n=1 Tax=Enorma TaxID=1472762 RepID=UPI000347C60B|nr:MULTISPECIES: C39 family peptidase [Enorma]
MLAIASAIGGVFGRLFGGWRNDAVFSRSGHRGHRRGTGYTLRSRYGARGSMHSYGLQPAVRPAVVLRTAAVGAVVLTLLSSIFFVDGIGVGTAAEASLLNMPVKAAGQVPVSTPCEEWDAGSLPYLYQTDPAWSSEPYAGGTVARNGCGPTCLAMIYVYLTGNTDMTPADMCALADAHGFAPTGATEHAFMTDGAALLGITGTAVNPQQTSEVASALRAGEPVVCAVRPGDFTPNGHFIILYGIDDANMVSVHDPNSSYRSAQKWGLQRVLSQTAVCWTFSL